LVELLSIRAKHFIGEKLQMQLSRRRIIAGMLVTAGLNAVAACGEPKLVDLPAEYQDKDQSVEAMPTITVSEEPVSVGPRGPVSVNLGVAAGNPLAAQLESQIRGAVSDAIDDAKNANEDLEINVVQISAGEGFQFQTDPGVFLQSIESALGDEKALDLLVIRSRPEMLALHNAGLLQSLDRLFSATTASLDDYYPAAAKFGSHEGLIWALPIALVPTVFFYGEQQFLEAGVAPPPTEGWTWQELQSYAEQLTIKPGTNGSTGQWGHYFTPRTPFSQSSSLILIWQNGGGIVDANGTHSLLAEPEAVDAMTFIQKMVHEAKVTPATDPDVTESTASGSRGAASRRGRRTFQLQANGQSLATMFGPASLPIGLSTDVLGVRIGGMVHGRREATGATVPAGMVVMDGASDPGDAFFALRKVSEKMEARMPFPARKTNVDEILTLSDGLSQSEAKAVLHSLETARVPTFEHREEILGIFADEIEGPVISGSLSAEEACQNGADAIDAILEDR
jgi:ABC-type glycerol-3-phosphate transport system substrate-binding protein